MSTTFSASLKVQVPLRIRRRPGRKTVVTPEREANPTTPTPTIPTRADPALVKALARAFRYQKLLDEEHYASITEMAEAEKLDRGYMGRLLQLTLLAPSLVEAALDRQRADQLDLQSLLKATPIKLGAATQRTNLRGVPRTSRLPSLDPLCAYAGRMYVVVRFS